MKSRIVIKAFGNLMPVLFAIMQLCITIWFKSSVSDSKTTLSFICEVVLNTLILIHFVYIIGLELINRLDLLATLHILIVSLTPTNYIDLIYSICCEVIPIQLLLLLVYNFDINSYEFTFPTSVLSLELYNLTLWLSLQTRLPSL